MRLIQYVIPLDFLAWWPHARYSIAPEMNQFFRPEHRFTFWDDHEKIGPLLSWLDTSLPSDKVNPR